MSGKPGMHQRALVARKVFGSTRELLRELKDDLDEIEAPPWFTEKLVKVMRSLADNVETECIVNRSEGKRPWVIRSLLYDAFGPKPPRPRPQAGA